MCERERDRKTDRDRIRDLKTRQRRWLGNADRQVSSSDKGLYDSPSQFYSWRDFLTCKFCDWSSCLNSTSLGFLIRNRDNSCNYIIKFLWWLNELIHMKRPIKSFFCTFALFSSSSWLFWSCHAAGWTFQSFFLSVLSPFL